LEVVYDIGSTPHNAIGKRIMELVSFISTDHHQFDLDLRKIDKEDIEQAKIFLKKMNFDNRFEIRIHYLNPCDIRNKAIIFKG
jgi:hypothetical protein